ncbi:17S U2 SnRNP complex component HTATSF1 [Plodia interpunctella]|uniref:17S U2 SnRNP complex component HTATSF1 n=1 Tax=Plodia interpunctella TaxID=58824 RepID=UPI002367BC6C|nr:HIV Tat-specific factor 1 [Plodia interpunctella]
MSRNSRSGFVIKLSCETVQKLAEEEEQAKIKKEEESFEEIDKIDKKEHETNTEKKDFEVRTKDTSEKQDDKQITDSAQSKKDPIEDIVEKSGDNKNPIKKSDSNTENSSWGDYAPYISYEGEEAIYTDPSTQHKYTWSTESNSWIPKSGQEVPGRVYSYEDDTHIYTEADGSKCFWDNDKKAWIPKVDDDFLAYYQMSYGFVDNTQKSSDTEKQESSKNRDEKKSETPGVKRKNEPQWFQPSEETNTKVYVSNLPLDLTEEEFVNFMQKCGLVERDPSSQKMKVKLYMDKEQNCFKGDALCTYIKIESVDLALKLLDGSDLKGNKVKVERAHFQLKGEYNPALKPKKKKKKELEKIKKMQQKLFDWRPEKIVGERSKHERVVIVKNLFHPTDFDKDVQLILDYQQDLREECSKSGEVRKVVIYDRHPEGVAQITMKEPEMADAVVELINGRWFGKRQITAEIWDGRTKFRIAETDADISKRIDGWDKFLDGKEDTDKSIDKTDKHKTVVSAEDVTSTNISNNPDNTGEEKIAAQETKTTEGKVNEVS